MRSFGKAVLAALVILGGSPAAAQDAPKAAAPATGLPKAPLPYRLVAAKPAAAPAHPAAPVAPKPVAGAPPLDQVQLQAFLDGWMSDAMAREHVPGAAVSIVQNGQVIFKKGYGFADLAARRPVDPDRTLFRLGSVSKTFTWVLVMREVEARRMRLDRPINLYLPEKVRLPGKSRDVMVANLMDHSAGFEDKAAGQLFENDPHKVRPLDLYLRQERPGRVRAAGVLSSYSNYGAALAGEAAGFVTGKTYERLVEDDITIPLGMGHTTFREPRNERRGLPAAMPMALRADVARGYGWRAAGFMPDDYEYIGQIAPAGAGSSTAGDMARYMLMLLGDGSSNGVTVFGPQTARAFRTPLQATPPGINGWAHGFMTFDLPGGHRGYGHLGHTIAFQTNMTVVPSLGLGVFVTTNGETGAKLSDNLPTALVRHFYAPAQPLPRPGTAELAAAGDAFEGHYISTRRAYGGLEGFVDQFDAGADVTVTSGGRLITETDKGSQAWVPDGPVQRGRFVSAIGDDHLAFRMGDGRADSFRFGDNTKTFERASLPQRPMVLISLAALAGTAAIATFAGLLLRSRRELRQNQIQARAGIVQNMQAGLWLTAMGLFGLWSMGASDTQAVMYHWPGALLVTASSSALVAAVLTLITIAAVPAIWQGGRRVDSWTAGRKVFFTLTVLIYTAFSVLLAMTGALEPWSG